MLSPEDAWRRLEPHLAPLDTVSVARDDALGLVLAEAMAATVDLPQADVSAMDGYVISGPAEAGAEVPVVATVAAGLAPTLEMQPGSAARIMTGAVIPAGGDRVVPVEQTDGGSTKVRLAIAPEPGAHIRRRAEVIAQGDRLLEPGAHVTPGVASLLAAHGYQDVAVYRRPRVAVLATGDEVVPSDQEPGPGQLRDSNGPFLATALRSLGMRPRRLGIAPDDRKALEALLASGLESDVLLVSGGVSMGEFDFAEEVLEDLGCDLLFDAVAVQPGKPLVAGRHAGGWVFGLPGNPASVMVTFWLFVRPVLNRLVGRSDAFWQGALEAEAAQPLPAGKHRDRFLAASIERVGGRLRAHARAPRGSHDLAAYGPGRALLRIPARAPAVPAGGACQVLLTVDWPDDPVQASR